MGCKHFTDYDAPGAAEQFEQEHFGNEVGRYLHASQLEKIRGLIREPFASVVDVGAGSGRLAIPLAQAGHCVVAADASEEMLNVARRKTNCPDNPRFQHCDAHELPFADQQFDYAVSIRTLMHFDRWPVVLSEICRVARRAVIIDVPPTFGAPVLEVLFDRARQSLGGSRKAYRTFRLNQIRRVLEENEFVITHVDKQFLLPVKLHRKLDALQTTMAAEAIFRRIGLTKCLGAPILIRAERCSSPTSLGRERK